MQIESPQMKSNEQAGQGTVFSKFLFVSGLQRAKGSPFRQSFCTASAPARGIDTNSTIDTNQGRTVLSQK